MQVYLSKLAESKLIKLADYLLEEWGLRAKKEFLRKLTEKIDQISLQPESCPKSKQFGGLYKCVVTKQTTLYYKIRLDEEEIEVITLVDTRQHPDTLKKHLK